MDPPNVAALSRPEPNPPLSAEPGHSRRIPERKAIFNTVIYSIHRLRSQKVREADLPR
jgi:hypothetical protein